MRSSIAVLITCISLAYSVPAPAESDLTIGIGYGALYAGLGVNVGARSETDFRYLSIGCVGFGDSSDAGFRASCGAGLGWIRTDILPGDDHGLGLYLGAFDSDKDEDTVYGVGLTYLYFLSHVSQAGWNFGATYTVGKVDEETRGRVLLNLGYQF